MLFRCICILLFLLYSSGSYAAWCNHDSGCGGSCSSDYVQDNNYSGLVSVSNNAYACANNYTLQTDSGSNPEVKAKIGWSDTCATPSGDNAVSQATCLTTHNLLGKVIDTFLTVGIAVAMFEQFCSFSAGDQNLEGAIVSQTFLSGCQDIDPLRKRNKCMACLFQGLSYDGTNNLCSSCTSDSQIVDQSTQCQECNVNPPASGCNSICTSGVCILPNVDANLIPASSICSGIPNFNRPVVDSTGSYVFSGGVPVYCPVMRCNVPTNDIKTKYHDGKGDRMAIIGSLAAAIAAATGGAGALVGGGIAIAAALTPDCCDLDSITDGQVEHVGFWGAVNLKGTTDGDRICAEMLMPDGYTTVACKFRVPPPVNYPPSKCTLENTACIYGAKTHGLWVMPITSTLMECVNDIINLFFQPSSSSLSCPTNHLFLFQSNLRHIVKIMLTLYVIIFGINLAFSGSPIKKGEVFSFIFKFALITYFAVGTFSVTNPNGAGSFDNKQAGSVSKNGLEYLKDVAFSGMNTFASIVINASGGDSSTRPCVFNPNDPRYQDNVNNYGYLALWDSLDCHLTLYLGLVSPTSQGLQSVKNGGGSFISGLEGVGVAVLILPAFFGFELFLLVFVIAFTVFLFSLIVYFANLYIVAMLAVTVLIFFGPFFIPMALFNYTRSMFDKWVNLLFGYALQPVVVSAFLALFITTFHKIIYSGCTFSPPSDTFLLPYWVFDTPVSETCQKTLGYITAQLNPLVAVKRVAFGGGIFYYDGIAKDWKNIVDGLLDALMLCTFFAFLFYYFAEQLSGLAADLTGSMVLGSVVSPNAVTDLAINKIGAKLSAMRENKQQQKPQQQNRKGINVSSTSNKGVSVSSTSGGAAQSNMAAFQQMPFAGGGDAGGATKQARVESAKSNREAFKEMPFAEGAHAYEAEQSNRKAAKEMPFSGMDDVKDAKQEAKKNAATQGQKLKDKAAAKSNREDAQEMPFAGGGDAGGATKQARVESVKSNREAFKEMPFAEGAHAYEAEQSNRKAAKEMPFSGGDNLPTQAAKGSATKSKTPRGGSSGGSSTF